jgi:hypothetical protein
MKRRVTGLGLALLLLRCAPLMTMQAPMLPGQDNEIGMGGGVSQGILGDCNGCTPLASGVRNTGLTGQIWYRHRFDTGFRLGVVASAGNAFAYAGGLRAEWDFFSSEAFQLSGEVECGWYWCGGGLPLAYRTEKDGLWLYGGPFANMTMGGDGQPRPILRLPVGFAIPFAGGRGMFLGELSAVYRPTFVGEGSYDGHVLLVVGGVGLVARL